MINVFFVPGMFGSTVEYVLSNYTHEHTPIQAIICDDGSMHSYRKQAHIVDSKMLSDFVTNSQTCKITTPIYPFNQHHFSEILLEFAPDASDHNILIYADSPGSAEINMLFQYYKISAGSNSNQGLKIFSGNNTHNIVNWNSSYTSWEQMQPWEWREWFSLFYLNWITEWQESVGQVPEYFLKIKNTDLLFDTEQALINIIDFCKLTVKPDLAHFVKEWKQKQQYIVDEFDQLDQMVNDTLNQKLFRWNPVCIVSEAVVQQRLRAKGYEIKCDGLNTFPTDSETLYNLLEKV